VYFDRDGVINTAVFEGSVAVSPRSLDELVIEDGVPRALQKVRSAGFAVVVVTNQPEVARGHLQHEVVDAMHRALTRELDLDAVYCCPHDNADRCACRKPAPGMLLDAARDLHLDVGSSWLVGDRWVDLAAAAAAGVRGVLLQRPYSWDTTSAGPPPPDLRPEWSAATLDACIDHILESSAREQPDRATGAL
jgi:D-glycero-D-manno-heptose 1,7-bisphosphate phosphatase